MTFENVPEEHIYFHTTFQAQNPGRFLSCLRKEMALLMFSLPAGIIVRGYENRVVSVLLSVLKRGETDRERERERAEKTKKFLCISLMLVHIHGMKTVSGSLN